jgi:hypothetical protein
MHKIRLTFIDSDKSHSSKINNNGFYSMDSIMIKPTVATILYDPYIDILDIFTSTTIGHAAVLSTDKLENNY